MIKSCCWDPVGSCALFRLTKVKATGVEQWRNISLQRINIRRKFAELTVNKFDRNRVMQIGPDMACLEWLMNCGATCVRMSDGTEITSQNRMRNYIKGICGIDTYEKISLPSTELVTKYESRKLRASAIKSDLIFQDRWSHAPQVYIDEVDASDAAISTQGFEFFSECRQIRKLKLNFCDYFCDLALSQLAISKPARTLIDLEIVMNPHITDAAAHWISQMRSLRRAHFYFLPYVVKREGMIRQLRLALPHCHVTFPKTEIIGLGYKDEEKC